MPKMKTNSGAKKRFKILASKKILSSQAGKQHNMRKRSKRMLREQRGTTIVKSCDVKIIRKHLPNG